MESEPENVGRHVEDDEGAEESHDDFAPVHGACFT